MHRRAFPLLWGAIRTRNRLSFAAGSLIAGGVVVHQLKTPVDCKASKPVLGHRVFAFGSGMSGALGTGGTSNSSQPTSVEALPGDAKQVSCGDGFSACVTSNGELWTFGVGRDGRLGHGDTSDSIYPRKIQCEPIAFVATGQSHAVALTFDGKALVWGRGFSGQLGLGDSKSHWSPQKLEVPNSKATGSRVVGAACGGSHSAVVLDSGQVWSFGRGVEGQLGDASRENRAAPVKMDLPTGAHARAVACGKDFTLVLLHDGRIFSTGSDQYGQLGVGKHAMWVASPVEVSALRGLGVAAVACGDLHAAAVTADGRLLTWGYGRAGQLGLNSTVDVAVPKEIAGLGRGQLAVASVACGRNHTVAVTRGGEALAWGRGREGQLGRGGEVESPTAYRTSPLRLEALRALPVLSAACGATHTLIRVLTAQ